VVDDDPAFADQCAQAVNDVGCNVMVAHDGVEGLELWQRHAPDLVLMDIHLPRVSGMALLEEKRTASLSGEVVVVSDDDDWKTIKRTARRGVSGYLLKSAPVETITDRVKLLLKLDPEELV
jgi:phosphoserine phosphatase RsbU/P